MNRTNSHTRFQPVSAFIFVLVAGVLSSNAHCGENTNDIVLGMSTALSGPTADVGINVKAGIEAALVEANQRGGVRGQRLRLIAMDDGYEPARTVINIRHLIEKENVLAIVGNAGTATAISALPIVNRSHVPFLFAYTGAGVLRRRPADRYVFNYRASYAEETRAMVDAIIEHTNIRPNEIAFFTQRDGYGDSGFNGGIDALTSHGLASENEIVHGRYKRNSLAIENALAEILFHNVPPKAIIMIAAYAPSAKFIEMAKTCGYDGLFLSVSFVGALPLAQTLGDAGDGVIVTQVVPHPKSACSIAQQYRIAMDRYAHRDAGYCFGSFEGYIAGRIVLVALQSDCYEGGRDELVNTLEALEEFSIGLPEPLKLTHMRHQASHSVWPTVIRNRSIEPMEWADLAGGLADE